MLHGNPSPKLGLLFLTLRDVNNPGIWQEFLDQAGREVSIFSHAKLWEELGPGFIADSIISARVETQWGKISLVRAMLALLEEAYANSDITHFAFLSGSCIPIKSWHRLRRHLQYDPRSMIAIKDGAEMLESHSARHQSTIGIAYAHWRNHPQWVLLDRDAATCILQRDITESFELVFAPDEHYFGTVLAMRGFPASRIHPVSPTWVDWSGGRPAVHDNINAWLANKLARSPSFFARKFSESADLPTLAELDSLDEASPPLASHG